MADIIPIDTGNIKQIVEGGAGALGLSEPFAQPIFLVDLHIAGTTHIHQIDSLADKLRVGDRLTFTRDKENLYDHLAIKVMDPGGNRLGFVPADSNEILARLMDGGKLLYGEVTDKELMGSWNKIEMRVFLDD